MEIDVQKYCHVSTFVSYNNSDPVYKQTLKFKISPSTHHGLLLDKLITFLKKEGLSVELKS